MNYQVTLKSYKHGLVSYGMLESNSAAKVADYIAQKYFYNSIAMRIDKTEINVYPNVLEIKSYGKRTCHSYYKILGSGLANTDVYTYYNTKFKDDLGLQLKKHISFQYLYNVLLKHEDVYKAIGISDSVVRERLFDKLADLLDTTYDYVYDLWMTTD